MNDDIPWAEEFKAGAGDEKLLVQFRMDILKDDDSSVTHGRPIWRDVEWVKIFIPGDKYNVIDRPASDIDKRRFAVAYARFQQGMKEEQQIVGTPLREWPLVTRAQVEELHYFHIITVEHLADCNEQARAKVPGLTQLAQQARIWLEKTSATAEAAKAAHEIDTLANKVEVLTRAVAEIAAERDKALAAARVAA